MTSKQGTIKLYKNKGETPLECIKRFKNDNPEYKDEKMTYAGRLDPLAEGLLLVLVGEECKNKDKYLGLDKEYELDILLGFSTDTYDILGKVVSCLCERSEANQYYFCDDSGLLRYARKDIQNKLESFVGKFSQKYPPYSSKTLKGKPLFEYAKEGSLDNEEIPQKEVEIKKIEILDYKNIKKVDLEIYIKESVSLVSGDFRQEEIIESWKNSLEKSPLKEYIIISVKVICTSGTYMRSLANSFGLKVDIPALAFNIKRLKMGDFKL
jgi:tRNA pseudouridine(55) synthase